MEIRIRGGNLLEKINSIYDLHNLRKQQLPVLVDEIRELLIQKISRVGGHLASNLGIVELTVALHYVFGEEDKFVFDGSHQTYTHKILTGRAKAFEHFKETPDFAGLSDRYESDYDVFSIGHTSNSIALACGLAKGRNLTQKHERIFAVIGDGALSGSEAYSGLNNAAALDSQITIIFNDNNQSIAKNYGGIYDHFYKLREMQGYLSNNFFTDLGFKYVYIEEGNDVCKLVEQFEVLKNYDKPLVIHVHTQKGNGYLPAIKNKEKFHFVDPFNIKTGEFLFDDVPGTYKRLVSDYLIKKAEMCSQTVILNSGIPTILDLLKYREKLPEKYIDTGICEDCTISIAAGLARQGIFPVVLQLSSFSQRMYDQLNQDIALNKLPLLLIVEGAGFSNTNASHVGIFDIALFGHIPNFIYMSPRNGIELCKMIDYAFLKKKSIGIRLPNCQVIEDSYSVSEIEEFKYEIVEHGRNVAILAAGDFFYIGITVYKKLMELGIHSTLINPRFINIVDEETLDHLRRNHQLFITIENGIKDGGFGSRICTYLARYKVTTFVYAFDSLFYDRTDMKTELDRCGMTGEKIVEDIINFYE